MADVDERRAPDHGGLSEYRIDPSGLARQLEDRAKRFMLTRSEANGLDRRRKIVRARICRHFMQGGKSAAAAAVLAEAHQNYTEIVEALDEAENKAAVAQAEYEAMRVYIDLLRTVNATAREEMRMGGLQT